MTAHPVTVTAEPGTPFIEIAREIDAPRDLVFRAYTEPDLLVRWLGPRTIAMTVEAWDVRDGGRWQYTHRDPAGHAYVFHGVFHGPQTPDRMTQTFEFDGAPGHVALSWVDFVEAGGRTLILTRQVHQTVDARDAVVGSGMAAGMSEGFERLDDLLTGLVPVA